MFRLHVSDALAFRQCRRRWYLGSKYQCNLEPVAPQQALWLGTGVHLGLEAFHGSLIHALSYGEARFNALDAFSTWAREECTRVDQGVHGLTTEQYDELQKQVDLGLVMLGNYEGFAEQWDRQHNVEYLQVEVDFEIPLTRTIALNGRMDGLVKSDGWLWILENKTARSIETGQLLLDEQAGGYVLAARCLFGKDKVAGILYNFLRKKIPVAPPVLRDGSISRNKALDTTRGLYLRAIKQAGNDPADYSEMLEILERKGNTFFHREEVFRTAGEIAELRRRLILVGQEMKRAVPQQRLYPTPDSLRCKQCAFLGVCIAMAGGMDWRFLLENSFRRRDEERARIDWGDEE